MHEESLSCIFSDAKDFPDLAQGLQYFVQRVMMSSDIAREHARAEVIYWACEKIEDVLINVIDVQKGGLSVVPGVAILRYC